MVKMKLFSVESRNRKPGFDTLEADVNSWLTDNPDFVIEHTSGISHPNVGWSHLALAVWYRDK